MAAKRTVAKRMVAKVNVSATTAKLLVLQHCYPRRAISSSLLEADDGYSVLMNGTLENQLREAYEKKGHSDTRPRVTSEQLLDQAGACSAPLVGWFDADFPEVWRHIPDPPLTVYVRGRSLAEISANHTTIAMVGARKATHYGRNVATELAQYLVRHGAAVVSGLAYGIDANAHGGAVQNGGVTVAILGGGIDRVYPVAHKRLAATIVERGGCVASEYAPDARPRPHHFLERNRLISGLSRAVVVIEAAARSGALNTAQWAAEQGRDLWAVPGSVHSLVSKGCHNLIAQGANILTEWKDIFGSVPDACIDSALPQTNAQKALSDIEQQIYLACCGGPRTLDHLRVDLLAKTSSDALEQALMQLEVRGFVRATTLGYIATRS
ncbi:MAG: DNA-processing protein DprA [Pseudomonadota bacterium]